MGLPDISVTFSNLATSAIQRSQRGIVALILKDDTSIAFTEKVYTSVDQVLSSDWTAANFQYIQDTLLGLPVQVIVERLATTATDYSAALAVLAGRRWNYLAIPGIATADTDAIATWIKTERSTNLRTFKAVLPLCTTEPDDEGVIEFATDNIVVGANTYTSSDYTARMAGILAGLPLTRSSTFFVLSEVTSIPVISDTDANTAINAGHLILINDGAKTKIARGVNSLTTIIAPKTTDWQKIKIIEGHDLVQDDIRNTFADDYVGKVINDYDNQAIFIAAVNAYLRGLEGDVLDPNGTNAVGVDIATQRAAWEAAGTSTSTWSDQTVKETAFQSNVYLLGNVKFVDAMEDLTLNIAS